MLQAPVSKLIGTTQQAPTQPERYCHKVWSHSRLAPILIANIHGLIAGRQKHDRHRWNLTDFLTPMIAVKQGPISISTRCGSFRTKTVSTSIKSSTATTWKPHCSSIFIIWRMTDHLLLVKSCASFPSRLLASNIIPKMRLLVYHPQSKVGFFWKRNSIRKYAILTSRNWRYNMSNISFHLKKSSMTHLW